MQAERHEYLDGLTSPLVKTEPKLIVEVISPGTAADDRGLKFSHYRGLVRLEEYVLIDLDRRNTDCYRKGGATGCGCCTRLPEVSRSRWPACR